MPAYPQFTSKPIAPAKAVAGAGTQTLVTAGDNGTRLDSVVMVVTTAAGVGGILRLAINDGSTDHVLDEIAIGSGSTIGAATSGLTPAFRDERAIGKVIPKGYSLKAINTGTGGSVDVTVFGGDY
jgi:hypothetical protein